MLQLPNGLQCSFFEGVFDCLFSQRRPDWSLRLKLSAKLLIAFIIGWRLLPRRERQRHSGDQRDSTKATSDHVVTDVAEGLHVDYQNNTGQN